MTKCYLAGPIRGKKDLNIQLFDHVANRLRLAGYEVCNPHDLSRGSGYEHMTPVEQEMASRRVLGHELHWLCNNAEILFLLPSWKDSLGATAEYHAALACGIEIREVPDIMLPMETELTSTQTGVDLLA